MVLLALAFLAESMSEYIFGLWLQKNLIRYVALAVGILLALAFHVDALNTFFGLQSGIPLVGDIVTGLIIGRGSNFVHDLYKTYVEPAPPGAPSG